MGSNPFNIGFGEKPNRFISRESDFNEIITLFTSETPESRALIISGPRGCGKTVLLSMAKSYFDETEKWITVDLNPYIDMHEQLASKLYETGKLKKLFLKNEFSFSFSGLSFSISGEKPISNVNSLLETILKHLHKKQIRILITIDDISPSETVKAFIYSFQSFIRESYPVFLLMTGLYENISSLENTRNLTFLLRTPKIQLKSLSLRSIAKSYQQIFKTDDENAVTLAKLTMGYAYGYQLLGNILYKNSTDTASTEIIDQYDIALEDNVYAKIWESTTKNEKKVIYAMTESTEISEILKGSGLSNSALQVYKKSLYRRGIADISIRGKLTFSLPRFKEFANFRKKLDEN